MEINGHIFLIIIKHGYLCSSRNLLFGAGITGNPSIFQNIAVSFKRQIIFLEAKRQDVVNASKLLHIYWVPGHKGITGNEIADQIAKSAVRLAIESVQEIRKSLKTICNEIFKRADRWIRARRNALRTCGIIKITCKSPEGKYASFLLT